MKSLILILSTLTQLAMANTANDQVIGCFEGVTQDGSRTKTALVVQRAFTEDSFLVGLTSNNSTYGLLFHGEFLDANTIGLKLIKLNADRTGIELESLPTALLRIYPTDGKIKTLVDIAPQADSPILKTASRYERRCEKNGVLPALTPGLFEAHKANGKITITQNSADDFVARFSIDDPNNFDLKNEYSIAQEITGLYSLRARKFGENFQKIEASVISAFVLPMQVDRKSGFQLIKFNATGTGFDSSLFKQKK